MEKGEGKWPPSFCGDGRAGKIRVEISIAKFILSIKVMVIICIFIEAAKLFGGHFYFVGASGMLADEKSGQDANPRAGAVR